jgi:hypothetical protein
MNDTQTTTTGSSTELTRLNALKHGVLSACAVLPWENGAEYELLLSTLVAEHAPVGPTESHLVAEVAGILWRKRRLRMAEVAAYRDALQDRFAPFRDTAKAALAHVRTAHEPESVEHAVKAGDADTEAELADLDDDEAMTRRAMELLASGRKDAYKAALAALREDTRDWWQEHLDENLDEEEDEHAYAPTAGDLARFIEDQLLPHFSKSREQLKHRPLIREQAFAEALPVFKLEKLSRYEVFLDRKLERTIAMLLKLKELRASAETA